MPTATTLASRLERAFGLARLPDGAFYELPNALRFELAGDQFPMDRPVPRFLKAFDRARAVANVLFAESPMVSAIDTRCAEPGVAPDVSTLNIYRELGISAFNFGDGELIPDPTTDGDRYDFVMDFPTDGPEVDIFIWSAVAAEMPIQPSGYWGGIWLVDMERALGMHVYDDRGMDLIAGRRDDLLPIYKRFGDWLLEYNRAEMDRRFADGTA